MSPATKSNINSNNSNSAIARVGQINYYDECPHDPRLTPDGFEHVCARCGVVLSPAVTGETATAIQKPQKATRINLYVNHQLGSVEAATTNARMQEMLSLSDSRSLKIARTGSDHTSPSRYLSTFSNACDRLGMSPVEAECAWQVFCKVYRQLCATRPRVISAVEAAFYSICCYCSTADEYEAKSAVSSSFGAGHRRIRDLYHLRIMVSTRVEGLPSLPGGGMRCTTSALWMHGTVARRFLNGNNGALSRQRLPVLPAYAMGARAASGRTRKASRSGR